MPLNRFPLRLGAAISSVVAASVLVACGGGSDAITGSVPAGVATASSTLALEVDPGAQEAVGRSVVPTFHLAPVLLDEPTGTEDAPTYSVVSDAQAGLSSRRLTADVMQGRDLPQRSALGSNDIAWRAGTVVATYTPAQIRAAYGLPALPASGAALTATQAAQLGAGQTIYILGAKHNPNIATELAAFNSKFGVPTCTTRAISTPTALPLAAPSAAACELSVVYATASGGMTSVAPSYDSGWATELALDVQWSHAIAPLARIVVIEAVDASVDSLLGAVRLANAMGPGVVSMSFGATEGTWTGSVDSVFSSSNMTYLAASGDNGAGVSWPAVSTNVLAVGGTTLTYSGGSTRSEVAWSGSGGGASAYTAAPSYQTAAVPGMGTVTRRNVPDVAMNADPSTGQYVAVISQGSTTPQWVSAGGTSLSTPQWAGLVAVANAMRLQAAKSLLGTPHGVLYGQIASVPGTYASTFADITRGSNGSCSTCATRVGYDLVTGVGTPNASSLLSALTGASVAVPAPVVGSATINGSVGTPLSFTASVSAANPVAWSLVGAPSGMVISSAGVVSWPSPVAGSYSVTVVAKDTVTGSVGQGVYAVVVTAPAAPTAPTVGSGTVSGAPGVALSFTVSTSSPNPVTYSLQGAPTGMTISSAGVVSWAKPLAGTYAVTVNVKDTKTGLTGKGTYTVKIESNALTITAPAVTGTAGQALTGTITIAAPGATGVSVTIAGAPLGMGFSISGLTITAKWPKAVAGSYSLSITVRDSLGRTAQASMPITVR